MNDAKRIQELVEAAENAVYWMLRAHAANIEEGVCDRTCRAPAYVLRLQAAVKATKGGAA